MLVLVVYVPESHVEEVKQSMFAAGAGSIGNYSCCAWQVMGQGQFMPSDQAKPFIGAAENVSLVPEFRVEMVCEERYLNHVIKALREAHPYEEPAFHVLKSVV